LERVGGERGEVKMDLFSSSDLALLGHLPQRGRL